MPERLDLRYANLAAAVADEPGGDRLDDLGVGQSVDDGDHRAEVDDARGVRSGWHRRAQSGALVAELHNSNLLPIQASSSSWRDWPTTLLFADPPTALAVTAEGASCVARAPCGSFGCSVSCMPWLLRVSRLIASRMVFRAQGESPAPWSWKGEQPVRGESCDESAAS